MIRILAAAALASLSVPVLAADSAPAAPNAAAMKDRLVAMDTDHDGKWSKAEWLAGGRRERGFDKMDADHDGYLTSAELQAGMARMRAARSAAQPAG